MINLQAAINTLFVDLPAWSPTALAMTGMVLGILTLLYRPRGKAGLRAAAIALIACQITLYLIFA